jgi:hypothetical protein
MNKKFSKIVGVGLTFMLLASLLLSAIPVSASTLSWGSETPPSTTGNVLGPAGIDINDLAANGDTIYAATDDAHGGLYKSTDGGATWVSLETSTSYPSSVDILLVAVAPDDPDIVIMGTSANEVEYSSNGGSSWTDLGAPATGATIYDIDVSPESGGVSYVAIGAATSGGDAEMYTIKLSMAESWTARASGNFTANQTAVMAVKFSPSFDVDKIISCVSGNSTGAYFQVFRYESGAYTWNDEITYYAGDGYNRGVKIDTLTASLASASLSLVPTYLGTDEGERLAFVGLGTANEGGAYRLTDSVVKGFQTWSGGDEGTIHSIAYHEAGKVLAGSHSAAQVYVCFDPTASTPKFERVATLSQPGGTGLTVVDWSGDVAVAGTSGSESAFAVSTDDGIAFADISLIDTCLTTITDVGLSADGSVVYLTSYDGLDASTWVKEDGVWKRVLRLTLSSTPTSIVRVAPDEAESVYVAFTGTKDVYMSKDAGANWKHYPAYKLTGVQDMAVESDAVVYALDSAGGGISKTTNSGASWGSRKTLDGVNGFMIALTPNGDILVGGSDGKIAFSTDGGSTFTATEKMVGDVSGDVRVVADADYDSNNIIYASNTGVSLYRGKASKTTSFSGRGPTLDSNHEITGLAEVGGLIYVLSANTTDSKLWRNMGDLATADTASLAHWSGLSTGNEYSATPQALKVSVSDGVNTFWAVDTVGASDVDSATDPLATEGATLKAPASGDTIPVNPQTGRAYTITFAFDRYPSSKVTGLQIQVATDSSFNGIITDQDVTVSKDSTAITIGPFAEYPAEYMPGYTYYWRVRVNDVNGDYMLSPWSGIRSFEVEPATGVVPVLTAPGSGANDVSRTPTFAWTPVEGATSYTFQIALDAGFTQPGWTTSGLTNNAYVAENELEYSTNYYWKVTPYQGTTPMGDAAVGVFTTMAQPTAPPTTPAPTTVTPPTVVIPTPIPTYLLWTIVGIGALLVIALIVLIVRTRRVA